MHTSSPKGSPAVPGSSTHTQRALLALRQRIVSGSIPGGARLFEVALAEDLKISRTPIRAALSQLAEEGLLERVRGGGFVVRSFALSDVIDTIELRGVLEGTAARLAAERGGIEASLQHLESCISEIDAVLRNGYQNIDIASYSNLNTQFHASLAAASGSPVIKREIDRITRLPFAAPSAFLSDELQIENFRRSLLGAHDQHRAIVEAIRLREGARAEALTREHARAARRNVEHLFQSPAANREGVSGLALVVS